jgi:hypothetical protein
VAGGVDFYSTAISMSGATPPTYVPSEDDRRRIQSYWTYENLYDNLPEALTASLRDVEGNERSRRLIPSARTLIEATNRYLAVEPALVLPAADRLPVGVAPPTDEQSREALSALQVFFDREEVVSKFLSLKRWMLIHGDRLFHITADPTKEEGSRISLHEIGADSYFPIHDAVDAERVTGCYLVNIITVGDGQIAQRLEYRKIRTQDDAAAYGSPVGSVWTRLSFWEVDGWDDRAEAGFGEDDLAPASDLPPWAGEPATQLLMQGVTLPLQITAIPVYHYRNSRRGSEPFGVSDIQGIETLIAGISQTATDEDLTVVLQGVGVYWTTSGKPRDENGNEVDWEISPASMLELERDSKVGRLQGATDIDSLLQHQEMMASAAREGTGTPDIAVGRIGSGQSAESGVALAIRFAPVVAKNSEKELTLTGVTNQLIYDLLNGWMPAYEGWSWPGVTIQIGFSDPLPVDRAEVLSEITSMVQAKIMSLEVARAIIQERLGYQFPEGMGAQVNSEQMDLLDAAAPRLDAAAGDGTGAI